MKRRDKEAGGSNTLPRADDDRLDNMGNRIADRRDHSKDFENKRIADRNWVVSRLPDTLEEIKECKFYFISFQHLLELDRDFLPLEIGMVEWCMLHGITKELHSFINPDGIPMGYRFKCQEHSSDTHQIPIDGFDRAEKDYRGLWNRIVNFINPNNENFEFPPVYCTSVEYPEVVSQLDWIFRYACVRGNNPVSRVFILEDLVQELTRKAPGRTVSVASCVDILTTTMFDYEPHTKCDYHDELENIHCALGTVKRYAFAMADTLSQPLMYDFRLTAKHLPQRTDERSYVTVLQPSFPAARGQGAAKAETSACDTLGTFGARDIRYREDVDQLVIKPSHSDDDSDEDLETEYSYSAQQRKRELLNVDRYNAPTGTWSSAASSRPDVTDEEEFPSLGSDAVGGRARHAQRTVAPHPTQLPKWKDDSSSVSSGWRPSARYLEDKREEEEARARQPSLSDVMAQRGREEAAKKAAMQKQPEMSKAGLGRGNSSFGAVSYSELSNRSATTSGRPGFGAASYSELSNRSATTSTTTESDTASVTSREGSESSTVVSSLTASSASNPWAAGARRAGPGVGPLGQGTGMIGLGRGRGRGSWVQPVITPQGLASRGDTAPPPPSSSVPNPPGSPQSTGPIESQLAGLYLGSEKPNDVKSKRVPPGFGRGVRRADIFNGNQLK